VPTEHADSYCTVTLGESHSALHELRPLCLLNELLHHGVEEARQRLDRIRVLPLVVVEGVHTREAADEALIRCGRQCDLGAQVGCVDFVVFVLVNLWLPSFMLSLKMI